MKFETLQEVDKNFSEIKAINEYLAFCKYIFKPKENFQQFLYFKNGKIISLNRNKIMELKKYFSFLIIDKEFRQELENNKFKESLFRFIKERKNSDTTKDFPLAFLKERILKNNNKTFSFEISKIQNISGIITEENNIKNFVEKLPKYSFAVWVKFQLLGPYFSRDDDELYIIQNPVLKEHVYKVPMVRGSSWKGALAGAFKKLFNEKDNSEKIESFLRIFGAGSESIKEIESYLREKSSDLKEFKDKILEFMLFELGMEIKKENIDANKTENDELRLIQKLKSKISNKLEKSQLNLPLEFQTHKGRAIFYPTYFDKISLEIINPHDRRKRAGTVPIHYEVVPKNTEGILQIVYIPFDGVLKQDDILKEEVKRDLNYLCKAINIVSKEGIGAKTKLGWGRFELEKKYFCVKDNGIFDVCEEWEKCQT